MRTQDIEGRKLPRGVKHLTTIVICSVRVPVVEATTEQAPCLAGNDGAFDYTKLVIYVAPEQSSTHLRDTVVHEVAHAFIYLSGLGHTLKTMLQPKYVKHWDGDDGTEETLVRMVTPHCVALIGQARWLAWVAA